MKKIVFIFIGIVLAVFIFFENIQSANGLNPQRLWQITAVDSVKYSRDPSRDPNIRKKIPMLVEEAAKLHVTHIAIDTPYDEEFYPILKAWVDEARKDHLKVWFRGNFSAWEGWFGYNRFTDVNQHHTMTKAFIIKHSELFQDGDIFTPVPEPENGGMGDPRGSDQKSADFNAFLIASYNNCVNSFSQINKKILCGFFSTNGDIAKSVLTPETIAQIGNIVVIDHYVDSTEQMQSDIDFLSNKFPNAKIVLGEFGAPIPDINGNMTENEQARFIDSLLQVFQKNKSKILGINYWTLAGGSTSLLRDDYSENKAFQTVANYYLPVQLQGRITDTLGDALGGVVITDRNSTQLAVSNSDGTFTIPVQRNELISLLITQSGYKPFHQAIVITNDPEKLQDTHLEPVNPGFLYRIRLFFSNLISL